MIIKRSFTLIELLVVVSIIGILSAIIIAIIDPAQIRKEARDATRRSDLAVVSSALEQYYADNNMYPDTSDYGLMGRILTTAGNIRVIPNDPEGYSYCYSNGSDSSSTPQIFVLCSQLEATTVSELNGVSTPCTPTGSGTAVYCVTNPF